ncbi:MATH domain-containing protein At5g43560-like isoform X2 [Olea europaea var. sylvestris]|uniref:MATH domain-containing protein At5g43560-like isoform X2 n=1 Tax=Olea europaea var. sylvestris TaxID=158386 RepID=UPI000C1D2ADB|nr:MATH domain-containing protein At5g43560-like isoform X2 [Olea europaea var. sylvestris]
MAEIGTEDSEAGRSRSLEGVTTGQQLQQCQPGEALAEWRSSGQLENGTPSTSPPYWDSSDDDGGLKPSELYGKYTWKIDKFSQINKRELRSKAFEVGGYKWYILIYPQGCDVCNHLSLFLCVANHDKLLPGWSHFAQFAIAVVNKDPKKSKYSDTLHRFCKKEHDWGWKKFMELSKVLGGFIDADTLIIKAQVQVIREKADRPFRCLDCQYRRELVRVYLTNVEQICRCFVEEWRGKLGMLIEDKARSSSFCTFWLSVDQGSRRHMCRERMDSILKIIVKNFFIEKEVTSTLVMDSLYSGLKVLEGQTNGKQENRKYLEAEELPVPIVGIDKDMFVLVHDVLQLLERAAIETLPPKDEKGPQNRTKDGSAGEEFNKDSIECDERRLTELGCRTIEIFVLAHIFSKIDFAYQEAVALKRQEELILEEAAWLAEGEQKVKRGAADKAKKSNKKQDKIEQESSMDKKEECLTTELEIALEIPDFTECVSDVSDSVVRVPKMLLPDSEERDSSSVNLDTDSSEVLPPAEANNSGIIVVQNGRQGTSSCVVDDSSSTCSSDSIPLSINVPHRGNSPTCKNQKSYSRGRKPRDKVTSDRADWVNKILSRPSEAGTDMGQSNDAFRSFKAESLARTAVQSLQNMTSQVEQHVGKKEEKYISVQKKFSAKYGANVEVSSMEKTVGLMSSPPRNPSKNVPSTAPPNSESKANVKPFLDNPKQPDRSMQLINSAEKVAKLEPDAQKAATPKPVEKPSQQQPYTTEKPSNTSTVQMPPAKSRPLSAPLILGPRPTTSIASMVQTAPLLARSVSAAGRLGPEPTSATQIYVPQSYRNVMMGSSVPGRSLSYAQHHSPKAAAYSFSQAPALVSTPFSSTQSSDSIESESIKPSISSGMANHYALQNGGPICMESPLGDNGGNVVGDHSSLHNDMQSCDLYRPVECNRTQDDFPSSRQSHGVAADEFPHMGIINELLDDEHGFWILGFQSLGNRPCHLNWQFSSPDEIGMPSSLGPSRRNSCRFERTQSYHSDVFPHGYGGAFPSSFDMPRNVISPVSPQRYLNGQIDGLFPTPSQIDGSDLSVLSIGNKDSNGYPYTMPPEYPNLAFDINRYTLFWP